MTIVRSVIAGGVLGCVLAGGVYSAVAADLPDVPTVKQVSYAPVPAPTQTVLADCEAPATLVGDECVTTVPGPTITLAATPPTSGATTPGAARSSSGAEHEDGDDDDESEDEHGEEQEHEEHEDD